MIRNKNEKWPAFPHDIVGIYISGDASIEKECVIF